MTATGRGKTRQQTAGSRPAAARGADIPDDPQALAEDIERTRQQVGDTAEALVAKLDPKAQLQETAERMKNRAWVARHRAAAAAGEVKSTVTDKAGPAAQQLRGTTAKAARNADGQRVPLAVAAGVIALLAGAWVIWKVRRR